MKIIILCNDTKYLVDHRSNLICALADAGHHVTIVAGGAKAWAAHLPATVNYHHLPLVRHRFAPWLDYSLVRAYYRLIAKLNPDVVHAFTIKPNLYSLIAMRLMATTGGHVPRIVLTFPGLGKIFEPGESLIRRRLVLATMRICSRNLDFHATFENHFDRRELVDLRIFPEGRCHFIMGAGINFDWFSRRGRANNGSLTFMFASRLLKAKGAGLFIEAAKLRRRKGSNAMFLVAGPDDPDNPDNLGLEQIHASEADGIVRYIGDFDASAMANVLANCDVICLPTLLREGLPRILLEAGVSGCAVIASDQPSIRSVVTTPESGWLLMGPDPQKIAAAMEEAEADPVRTRAIGHANAIRFSAMPVDDSSIVAAFMQLYE